MINDIQQNYKYFHNHTKIFKQIFIFFHGEAHRLIGSSLRLRVDDEPREGRSCGHALTALSFKMPKVVYTLLSCRLL